MWSEWLDPWLVGFLIVSTVILGFFLVREWARGWGDISKDLDEW